MVLIISNITWISVESFTNVKSCQRTIDYHSFNNGDKLCNVLYNGDCVTVTNKKINYLKK